MEISIFGKSLAVISRGKGHIPLLVLGPATLYTKQGILPSVWDDHFTIYFVDIYTRPEKTVCYRQLALDDFVDAVESIRDQLKLEKIALFAHSISGVLAIEYAAQYLEKTVFIILANTMPTWGKNKQALSSSYFFANADDQRKEIYAFDQALLSSSVKELSEQDRFVTAYQKRRTYFFKDYQQEKYLRLWDGIHLDMVLVNRLFTLVSKDNGWNINKFPEDKLKIIFNRVFLILGLYDYSCPFYSWTDDLKTIISNSYISESDHYPMTHDRENDKVTPQLLAFMEDHIKITPNISPKSGI